MPLTVAAAGVNIVAPDTYGPRRAAVLVVDDEPINRALIAGILHKRFDVIQAASGLEAVAAVARTIVDIVVMDIQMPEMDGFEATRRLKAASGDRFLPVVLMTASNDEALLADGLARGADDFLIKPASRVLLEGKIVALLRAASAFHALREQNQELTERRAVAETDYDVARRVFERAASRSRFDLPDLVVHAFALERFNGDFVLAAVAGDTLRLLVGDFAGHGLRAAVGALPASEIFYSMTERGLGLGELAAELGAKLHRMFPRDLFLSACLVDVDLARERVSIWNAGLPDVLILDATGAVTGRLASRHLPAGVLPAHQIDPTAIEVPFPCGSRLAICSDGLIESRSPDGTMFGAERLQRSLGASYDGLTWPEGLWAEHQAFCAATPQEDDVTFVGLTHTPALARKLREIAQERSVRGVRDPVSPVQSRVRAPEGGDRA